MQLPIVLVVGRLVAQQVPVRSCREVSLIAGPVLLADGERHRAVGIPGLDRANQAGDAPVGEIRVLPALEHKGPKSQLVSGPAALQNLLFCQAVAGSAAVVPADTAVIAVVFTVIGKFDEAPDVDLVSENPMLDFPGPGKQIVPVFSLPALQETGQLRPGQLLPGSQTVDEEVEG